MNEIRVGERPRAGGEGAAPVAAADRTKGPRVWLDMDQQELDDAYDQLKYAANAQQLAERRAAECAQVRARLGEPERIAYGASAIETIDFFRTDRPNAPIAIFVHGGAWRARRASEFCTPAEMFVRAGAHCAFPDFTGVDQVNGDIGIVADQVLRAVGFIHDNAARFGGEPQSIYLFGHSSGAHLAGVLATTDWRATGRQARLFRGILLASGMYDLAPVRLSKRSSYVAFTDVNVERLSAMRHIEFLNAPLVLAYGTYETPEFQRQTREFHAAVADAGKPVELIVAPGYNHFEIFETLANPYGVLGRAALKLMGLAHKA
jgi:arylformamidase